MSRQVVVVLDRRRPVDEDELLVPWPSEQKKSFASHEWALSCLGRKKKSLAFSWDISMTSRGGME